ncbi:hypothetical protein SpAn4DRAFT_4673 [Sporomusa ovata]|uniref:Uncharacterized protein n=1 Tax=Sporomusa ovata TaxID=2378 RepID=A0A0U1KRY3_9FIRM|nr:hypothetical protein SpAn4DRAFT_4673 [Sporomusa ovata]
MPIEMSGAKAQGGEGRTYGISCKYQFKLGSDVKETVTV